MIATIGRRVHAAPESRPCRRHRNRRRISGNERVPCCAMMAPIRKVISTHDRDRLKADLVELIDQRCQRAAIWPAQHVEQARKSEPSVCRNTVMSSVALTADAADVAHPTDGVRRGNRRGIVTVDLANLLDRAGVVVRRPPRCRARPESPPRHLLEQPGPERIELAYLRHIQFPGAGAVELRRNRVGERLQRPTSAAVQAPPGRNSSTSADGVAVNRDGLAKICLPFQRERARPTQSDPLKRRATLKSLASTRARVGPRSDARHCAADGSHRIPAGLCNEASPMFDQAN